MVTLEFLDVSYFARRKTKWETTSVNYTLKRIK